MASPLRRMPGLVALLVQVLALFADVRADSTPPSLSGVSFSVTFLENTVNGAPQLLDANVTYADGVNNNAYGGQLRVSGLLPEDRVFVRNQGNGAGQIGYNSGNYQVSYGGVPFGTYQPNSGVGTDLIILFNLPVNVQPAAIEALLENLTYANVSETPTPKRRLVIRVQDSDGYDTGPVQGYGTYPAGTDPFRDIDVGDEAKPALDDLNGDGLPDLVVGSGDGNVRYFRNTGTATIPYFDPLTETQLAFGFYDSPPIPGLAELDGDGDRDLVVGKRDSFSGPALYYRNNGTPASPNFSNQGEIPNIQMQQGYAGLALADMDADGDVDLIAGNRDPFSVMFRYFRNNGTPSAMNFANGVNFAGFLLNGQPATFSELSPALGDLDQDGDFDMLVANGGRLLVFTNTGTSAAANFSTGASPFVDPTVWDSPAPALRDLNGDGRLDVAIGQTDGTIITLLDVSTPSIVVNVTAQQDEPVTAAVAVSGYEDAASITIPLSATDGDGTVASFRITSLPATGTLYRNAGLTAPVVLNDILAASGNAATLYYVPPANFSGAPTFGVAAIDNLGLADSTPATVTITVNPVNDAPVFTGLAASVTFLENRVNAEPQLLDVDVAFTDVEGDFNGGWLWVSGLLPEDRLSIRHQGMAAGQIGVVGSQVSFGGVVIGGLSGGAGTALTVAFNAAASAAAIDALVQNIQYANVSDTPTASRRLVLSIVDAGGASQSGTPGAMTFSAAVTTELVGAANPFGSIDVGSDAAPTFGDFNGDGRLDLVAGNRGTVFFAADGAPAEESQLYYFVNTGAAGTPSFAAPTDFLGGGYWYYAEGPGGYDSTRILPNGTAFPGRYFGLGSPAVLSANGFSQGLIVGDSSGRLRQMSNWGSQVQPKFLGVEIMTNSDGSQLRVGANNSKPALGDLDQDGLPDLVVGLADGQVRFFKNQSGGAAFVQLFVAPALIAYFPEGYTAPALGDLDRDGDLDLVVGNADGRLFFLKNTGTPAAYSFASPVDLGRDVGDRASPALADLDGDGDLDLAVGNALGNLRYFRHDSGPEITVNVTPQMEPVPASLGVNDASVSEGSAGTRVLNFTVSRSNFTVDFTVDYTVFGGTARAGEDFVAASGRLTFADTGEVPVIFESNGNTVYDYSSPSLQQTIGVTVLGDTAIEADETFTVVLSNVVNRVGTTVIADAQGVGTILNDDFPPNTPPSLTGLAAGVTFPENLVSPAPLSSVTPQVLDADVTFTDPDNNFAGGTLVVSGLLNLDKVTVRHQGNGAGQIGLPAGEVYNTSRPVYFGGVQIGTVTGGWGVDLGVTFNASATAAAIEALVENLTFVLHVDGPPSTRTLSLRITDSASASTGNLSIAVEVAPENDPPVFFRGSSRAHPFGTTAAQIVPGWATQISDGDPWVTQALTFQVSVEGGSAALFSVPPSIDSAGTLTYTLNGTAGTATVDVTLTDDGTAGGAALTSAVQIFTITTQAGTPLQVWKLAHLGDANAPDTGDTDGDGYGTLAEYALVFLPTAASPPLAGSVFAYGDGRRLRLRFSRDSSRNDVTMEVQAAGDPSGPWTTVAGSVMGAPFSGPGYVGGDGATAGVKTVEVRDTVDLSAAPRRYMRVKVTR